MKTYLSAVFAALLLVSLASAQTVIIDDVFGDGNPETNTDGFVAPGIDGSYYIVASDGGVETEGTGIPEVTESGGALKFDPSANGNWARGELISKHDFPLPTAGTTRTFSWTIGPVTPISIIGGDDYRIQLNAINAARTQDTNGDGIGRGHERFALDGTGEGASAISLDLYFEEEKVFFEGPGTVLAQLWEKDSTFDASSNGSHLDPTGVGPDLPFSDGYNFSIGDEEGIEWDFWVDSNTFSLEMSDTGYTWSDSVTGFEFSRDYTTQQAADFAGGYWAFMDGQNRDFGRGFHELSRFMVTETGAVGLDGDFDGDGDVDGADFLTWQRDLGDAANLALWQSNYVNPLSAASGASAVPEPTGLAICLAGLAFAGGLRRKRA